MSRTEAFARKSLQVGLASLSYVAPALAGRIATSLWFTPFPLVLAAGRGLVERAGRLGANVAWPPR